jgi:hypothetical protein
LEGAAERKERCEARKSKGRSNRAFLLPGFSGFNRIGIYNPTLINVKDIWIGLISYLFNGSTPELGTLPDKIA